MKDLFITGLHIKKVRHLEDVEIKIDTERRRNLIITGNNGSGKTSVLEALRDVIADHQQLPTNSEALGKGRALKAFEAYGLTINPEQDAWKFYKQVEQRAFAYISARRNPFKVPKQIKALQVLDKSKINVALAIDFLQYILNLDYQLYGALADKNAELQFSLTTWFDKFTEALQEIYSCPELELQRDTINFSFKIKMPDREPFALSQLSDGYAAFLNIYMELLMRLETADGVVDYNEPAIVLVDEIEAHLHVALQKKILPFLTTMFPHVQFIVTTHSPFVITSLENAVVYDLEMRERLENPSFYAYDTIVESFLGANLYSSELQEYFRSYKALALKERSPEENKEFLKVRAELEIRAIPSTELYIAFQQIEAQRVEAKNG